MLVELRERMPSKSCFLVSYRDPRVRRSETFVVPLPLGMAPYCMVEWLTCQLSVSTVWQTLARGATYLSMCCSACQHAPYVCEAAPEKKLN